MSVDIAIIAGVGSAIGVLVGAVGTVMINRRKQKHSENQDWYKAVTEIQTKFDDFKDVHLKSSVTAATEKEHLRATAELLEANHKLCEEKHSTLEKQYNTLHNQTQELHESHKKCDQKQMELEKRCQELQMLCEQLQTQSKKNEEALALLKGAQK